jgi:hypothetical protein
MVTNLLVRLLGLVWLTNDGEPHQGASIIKLEQRRRKGRGSNILFGLENCTMNTLFHRLRTQQHPVGQNKNYENQNHFISLNQYDKYFSCIFLAG